MSSTPEQLFPPTRVGGGQLAAGSTTNIQDNIRAFEVENYSTSTGDITITFNQTGTVILVKPGSSKSFGNNTAMWGAVLTVAAGTTGQYVVIP